MLFILDPNIIIIRGPKAILGRLFNIVRNGSSILDNILNSYNIIAIINPNILPIINDIITSFKVVYICINKLLLNSSINVLYILDGLEYINELIIPL